MLTDLCNLNKHNNCKAGDHHFTYAPNGKIYICSSYYSSGEDNSIGNISEGLINFNNSHLYKLKYNALCNLCDAYQCKNCIYINESATKEVNVSPSYQCRKSFIEREMSRQYQVEINCSSVNLITPMAYQDPMSIFLDNVSALTGYYKF